jgi:hypothetical protein
MAIRAQNLKSLILKNSDDAKGQLQAWEVETIHNLGLEGIGFTVMTR